MTNRNDQSSHGDSGSGDRTNSEVDREVMRELESGGALAHEELADRVGISWDALQQSIRRLRHQDDVVIRLDRRYEPVDIESGTGRADGE